MSASPALNMYQVSISITDRLAGVFGSFARVGVRTSITLTLYDVHPALIVNTATLRARPVLDTTELYKTRTVLW